jgi:hypothetical protein
MISITDNMCEQYGNGKGKNMAAVASNIYQQFERKPTVIKYCVEVLRNRTRHYCSYKVVHVNLQ